MQISHIMALEVIYFKLKLYFNYIPLHNHLIYQLIKISRLGNSHKLNIIQCVRIFDVHF